MIHHSENSGRESVIFERNWSGRGVVYEGGYPCFDSDVEKFERDEDHGLILAVSSTGVLTVRTLDDLTLIWSQQDVGLV